MVHTIADIFFAFHEMILREKREGTEETFLFCIRKCNGVGITSKKPTEDICCSCFCIISFIPKANAR